MIWSIMGGILGISAAGFLVIWAAMRGAAREDARLSREYSETRRRMDNVDPALDDIDDDVVIERLRKHADDDPSGNLRRH